MGNKIVIFRADASTSIGMGHFTRSLALAEMLNEHFHCIFATRNPSEYQIAEIKKICHGRIDLPEEDSHFNLFLNQLKGDEIVVLDNYYFDTNYQRAIKNKGCKLVCIDDMHDKHYVADIVINNAKEISRNNFSIEKYTQLLLGYKYSLLRTAFLDNAKEQRILKKEIKTVFINLGGTDPEDIVIKTTNTFLRNKYIENINLVSKISPEKFNNTYNKKISSYWNLPADKLSNIMLQSDIGFLPASTISIEACACQLPLISGWFVENQLNTYNTLIKNGLAIGVDNMNKISDKIMHKAISKITKKGVASTIASHQNKEIDGKSNIRIQEAFKNL